MSDQLHTARLLLRPPVPEDLEALHRLQSDPRMMRYISDGHVYSRNESEVWLRYHIDLRRERGFGLWCAELRETGDLIGWVDLALPDWFPAMLPTPEVGWFIDRRYWGRGLAGEGGAAALGEGFERHRFPRIIAICDVRNRASSRVMEKIGMTWSEERPHPEHGFPLNVYAATNPSAR